MNETALHLCRRLDQLKSQKSPHESVWQECFDYTFPLRGDGLNQQRLDAQQGLDKKSHLLDSTGTDSARTLAANIQGGMTPANSLWFGLDADQDSEEERRWLDDAAKTIWKNIHSSNFDSASFEGCLDVVAGGWFGMYVDEDRERGGLTFELWPLSQLYVAASKPGGRIDTVFRVYRISAEQAVNEFGEQAVSEKTRILAKDKPDEMVDFLRAIYPRKVHAVGARLAKNLPIASVTVELGAKKVVRESGYHEMPVIVPRWSLLPNSHYAVGPVFDALPDIKELNELLLLEKAAADIAVSGMWIAEDDGVLNPKTVKVGPRKIIVANSVDSMKELKSGSDFNVSFTLKAQLQAQIRRTLMADQLQPQDGPQMTATEVHVRVGLIRQLLGPIYGRLQAEYLQPLIERCFGICLRAGILGTPPRSLLESGREINIKFVSPLARAQKLEEVTAIERLNANLAAIAQVKPDVMDLVDADEEIRVIGEALGVPSRVLRPEDDVIAIREARAEAERQAAERQQMMAMGQALMETGT